MGDIDIRAAALVVFLAYLFALGASLLVDLLLYLTGQPTISQTVWKEPMLAIPVLLPCVGMLASLAVHLLWK